MWDSDWYMGSDGEYHYERRDECGLTEEGRQEQERMQRQYLVEEYGEDGP